LPFLLAAVIFKALLSQGYLPLRVPALIFNINHVEVGQSLMEVVETLFLGVATSFTFSPGTFFGAISFFTALSASDASKQRMHLKP
jgi:hypothetical protein